MSKLALLLRGVMLAGLLFAAVASTGCRMYPAGYGTSCGCDGCASCGGGGMPMGGQGCGCGLAAKKSMRGNEVAEAGPPAMPAPQSRFHPVPTRPVFAQRGPTLATREVEVDVDVEFDLQRDSTARGPRSTDRTASAQPTPRLARRPESQDLPLEPAATPTPATRPQPMPTPAEPRALPGAAAGALMLPGQSTQPRRAVVSTFDAPKAVGPAAASELRAQPVSASDVQPMVNDAVWRARLMAR